MDLSKLAVFGVVKKRFAWLNQRQEVLTQNIANSDTPDYRPRDMAPFDFKDVLRRESMHLNLNVSDKGHLGGGRKRLRDFTEEDNRRPYETKPDGNSVVLEEQMAKMNENSLAHAMTSELYKKHLRMLRIAIGKN